jgi:RNA polymerase sigma factor (sigma-70 family)
MFKAFLRRRNVGPEDAEDIVQNALTKIAKVYRQESAKNNFAAWCQTVLKNQFIDFCRARSSAKNRQIDPTTQVESLVSPGSDHRLRDRMMICLRKLHQANPLHARLINLHYQGYTTSEVCDRLKITANNRRVAMCRARALLRACLKGSEGPHE